MGAISIGLPRGSSTVQLDGRSLQNAASCLVCFLYHCYGLPTNSPHDCAIICRGCEIRREQGIRICRRRILTRASFLAQILPLNEHGEIWYILSIAVVSDKRQRRFRYGFRLNWRRVVTLPAGRDAVNLPTPIRRFGRSRIMRFPPGGIAFRLLLVERQLGEAGS